jgi:xanthine dehydrogenase small subunit
MVAARITVNGKAMSISPAAPHTTVLDFLRERGLTGSKKGCAEGECGACSVLVARPGVHKPTDWVALNACLAPVAALDGQEIVTSEGLATAGAPGTPPTLHPVQEEMAERGGSQCGYCTPGFVCSMAAEYYRPDRCAHAAPADGPDPEHGPNGFDLHALSGNLCRCTGYRPIRDAAFAVGAPAADDPLAQRREQAPPEPVATEYTRDGSTFVRPRSLAEALRLLREQPDAVVVAGSTDWGVEVNIRARRARCVVAVDRLAELRALHVASDHVEIGAALTLTETERRLDGRIPLLAELFPQFASRLIRNGAALGGNLGTGSPIGDSPPVLLALEASVVLADADGEREIPLADYFTGYRQSVRRPGELIRSVRIPLPLSPVTAFHKIAKRRFDDISSVAVAFALDVRDGTVRRARIGLGGVAATPVRALAARGRPGGQAVDHGDRRGRGRCPAGRGHADGRPPGQRRVPRRDARPEPAQAVRPHHRGGAVMSRLSERPEKPVVGVTMPHESAHLHVTGAALYTDDLVARTKDVLHAHPVQVMKAHARVTALRTEAALAVPGVVRVLTVADVPGVNDAGMKHDEPLFPDEVMFHGHAVAWVLGESLEAARLGAAAVEVELDEQPALLTLQEAIAADSFHGARPVVRSGDVEAGFADSVHVFSGTFRYSGQEHFYLETHAALAQVDENGQVFVQSSTQHPSETQEIVAHVLGLHSHEVTVQCLRMGGGFGGKEMQPHGFAAIAALGARLTGRPVRLRLNRTQDLTMSGKRHGFHAEWRIGFDADGRIQALDATLTADGGWSLDLSEPVLARALCHIDNTYWIPHARIAGRIAKTHTVSNTAFRGFGGPQGMLVLEDVLGRCAPLLGLDPMELRERNFYRPCQSTPYGQPVPHAERIAQRRRPVRRTDRQGRSGRRRRPQPGDRDPGPERTRRSGRDPRRLQGAGHLQPRRLHPGHLLRAVPDVPGHRPVGAGGPARLRRRPARRGGGRIRRPQVLRPVREEARLAVADAGRATGTARPHGPVRRVDRQGRPHRLLTGTRTRPAGPPFVTVSQQA